jgi:hypothetical protein
MPAARTIAAKEPLSALVGLLEDSDVLACFGIPYAQGRDAADSCDG